MWHVGGRTPYGSFPRNDATRPAPAIAMMVLRDLAEWSAARRPYPVISLPASWRYVDAASGALLVRQFTRDADSLAAAIRKEIVEMYVVNRLVADGDLTHEASLPVIRRAVAILQPARN